MITINRVADPEKEFLKKSFSTPYCSEMIMSTAWEFNKSFPSLFKVKMLNNQNSLFGSPKWYKKDSKFWSPKLTTQAHGKK